MNFKNKTEIIFSPFFSSSESQILCLPLIPALTAKYDKGGTGWENNVLRKTYNFCFIFKIH
jgi:hypothetical protein